MLSAVCLPLVLTVLLLLLLLFMRIQRVMMSVEALLMLLLLLLETHLPNGLLEGVYIDNVAGGEATAVPLERSMMLLVVGHFATTTTVEITKVELALLGTLAVSIL